MTCPIDGSRACNPICSGCGGPDGGFLRYALAQYDDVGQELFELPDWAWLRRTRLLRWRAHYAGRIADELLARLDEVERASKPGTPPEEGES